MPNIGYRLASAIELCTMHA